MKSIRPQRLEFLPGQSSLVPGWRVGRSPHVIPAADSVFSCSDVFLFCFFSLLLSLSLTKERQSTSRAAAAVGPNMAPVRAEPTPQTLTHTHTPPPCSTQKCSWVVTSKSFHSFLFHPLLIYASRRTEVLERILSYFEKLL